MGPGSPCTRLLGLRLPDCKVPRRYQLSCAIASDILSGLVRVVRDGSAAGCIRLVQAPRWDQVRCRLRGLLVAAVVHQLALVLKASVLVADRDLLLVEDLGSRAVLA